MSIVRLSACGRARTSMHKGRQAHVALRGLDRAGVADASLVSRRTDLADDGADLGAEEDERDHRNDRDQGKDQRVFGETLAVFPAKGRDRACRDDICLGYLLPMQIPRSVARGRVTVRGGRGGCQRPGHGPPRANENRRTSKVRRFVRSLDRETRSSYRRCSGSWRPGRPGR